MASLDWYSLNNSVRISYTKKKFFNEFLFKLTYRVPAANMLTRRANELSLAAQVEAYNISRAHFQNWSWTWKSRMLAEYNQLSAFKQVYNKKSETLKFRVDQDTISMYSNSDLHLYQIANVDLMLWTDNLYSVSLVESDSALELLNKGYTITENEITHPYRVNMREGFPSIADKQALGNYLKALGSDIKITKFMLSNLDHQHKYFRGGYLYVNDIRLVDVLRIISPTIIGSVNQLVINN